MGRAMDTESTPASRLASMSDLSALLVAMMEAFRPMRAMRLTVFFSSSLAEGTPTLIWATPALSRPLAILYFSVFDSTTPAAFSESLIVVSQMQMSLFKRAMTSSLLFMDLAPGVRPLSERGIGTESVWRGEMITVTD